MQHPLLYHIHSEFDDVFACRNSPLRGVNTAIHEDDEMFSYIAQFSEAGAEAAVWEYFNGGLQMLNLVEIVARKNWPSLDRIGSFLDFASGYGRFTRFLVKKLSPARVWASDIYSNAVKFQQQQFDVHGLESVPDPENYVCEQRFDVIFVASLFSHLPETTCKAWLRKLYSLLAPDGLLLFSVHGETLLPTTIKMPASGFFFQPQSESRSLDKEEYGSAWVTEDFMRKVIREITGQDTYIRARRGLWNFQDVYLIAQNGNLSSDSEIAWGPDGRIEKCEILGSSELLLSGWAADLSPGGSVSDLQVWIDGEIIAHGVPEIGRADVVSGFDNPRAAKSGWRVVCPAPAPKAKVVINAVSNRGAENFLRPASASLLHSLNGNFSQSEVNN